MVLIKNLNCNKHVILLNIILSKNFGWESKPGTGTF